MSTTKPSSPTVSRLPPSPSSSPKAIRTNDTDDDASVDPTQQAADATFPQRLMDAIELETTAAGTRMGEGQRVFEWLPGGDAFVIRDKALFECEVLTKHLTSASS